ncbi:MAG: hypothetical protein ACI9BD_000660, partial [Candidatus Marinamargulisbacteria bacterium]
PNADCVASVQDLVRPDVFSTRSYGEARASEMLITLWAKFIFVAAVWLIQGFAVREASRITDDTPHLLVPPGYKPKRIDGKIRKGELHGNRVQGRGLPQKGYGRSVFAEHIGKVMIIENGDILSKDDQLEIVDAAHSHSVRIANQPNMEFRKVGPIAISTNHPDRMHPELLRNSKRIHFSPVVNVEPFKTIRHFWMLLKMWTQKEGFLPLDNKCWDWLTMNLMSEDRTKIVICRQVRQILEASHGVAKSANENAKVITLQNLQEGWDSVMPKFSEWNQIIRNVRANDYEQYMTGRQRF